MAYATINPFTEEQVKTFPTTTDAEIETAIAKGDAAFQKWKNFSHADRARILQKAADLLRENLDEYSKLLTLEMGKRFAEAQAETELSAAIFEYYAKNAEKLLEPQDLPVADPQEGRAKLVYEPQGIIVAIEPWNFPFYQVARIISPQLSAGNTVILKHASNVPQCAAAMEKLMLDAGLPEGGFINLYPSHSQLATVIQDPRVRGVALTGSEGAGAKIAATAGGALKKCIMELGGSDALIVLNDADIEKAAKWAVFGRHWNGGQVCVNAKRMIVEDGVYDKFVELYRKGVSALRMGDPMDPNTTMPPLSSRGAVEDLKKQVSEAVAHGAKAEEVPLEMPNKGCFFRPVILTDLDESNPARRWEFFGPVTMLFRAKDADHAVEIANDSPYGLGGSIFSQNEEKAAELARKMDTGMVYINHPTMVKADLPFGGVKRSGFGRELIDLGLKEFVNTKLIDIVDIDAPF
ncbi:MULTISPECIES: NAD-dependent succinate-semialdehyde dehydrogenase [Acetobacter]|uniref:Succinate-semialdehyde dehydrogenase n=3 Tax=Acetobacter TaxID=434 RepID=F1YUB6_9PROT|nr:MULTISPECIES: NAD-dependent succinate-semialdehyde dehydrogenase [Acetobacter]ANA12622.1 succinate-semialdehyde dehydrogenase [Acetobacter oryzifermentans]ASL39010.1 succinate-semialdehyde dehydrogenase [Acetobacter oryzifermentans]ATI12263.1 succinate-semialdehyde dehydrogenase [Acetobacter pomorum]AXC25375.1 NAD-dependent succinate-semialdehyde dehydrogenase [Acetobacter sp. JWB]AXN01137.1 succinate-semialdehyde dehydrogenase [Acetobacter pomorum]